MVDVCNCIATLYTLPVRKIPHLASYPVKHLSHHPISAGKLVPSLPVVNGARDIGLFVSIILQDCTQIKIT